MSEAVLLYTSPGCSDCAAVKEYLKTYNILFEERDISEPGVAEEAKSRYGVRIAPITVINGEPIWGTFAQQKPQLEAKFNS